jgi:uncharacterized membrane protein YfcA
LIIFLSNVVQTITGFAGTLLAMPPAIALVGISTAKMTLNFFGLAASLVIWMQNRKHSRKKEVQKMIGFMGMGMILGYVLEHVISTDGLVKGYAVFLILFGVYKCVWKKKPNRKTVVGIIILVLAGMIHEWFVSGGALLVIYATATFKDKNEFRASLAPVWVVLNTMLCFLHVKEGYASADNLWKCLWGLIPLFLAIFLGNKLHDRVKQEWFLKMSYILIVINGFFLL